MIAKCSCHNCGVNIEFDTQEYLSGGVVVCPKCRLETVLSVSNETAPPKPDVFVVDMRLCSGLELRITAVRLYEESAIANLNTKRAEASKLLKGVSIGIGAIGSVEWVVAASTVIGAAEAVLSADAASDGLEVLKEAIRLERKLYESGTFVPIGEVRQIQHPFPNQWRALNLIHDGNDFVTVMSDDDLPSSIRWSSVERFVFRKL